MSCLLFMPSPDGMLAGGVAGTSCVASAAMAPSADEMLRVEDMRAATRGAHGERKGRSCDCEAVEAR
eukprot:5770495-Prymnesium_polylepis.1